MPALVAGDPDRILAEWRRLIGDPSHEPEDLSTKWSVSLGTILEPHALNWHERRTGYPLIRRGEVVTHPELSWLSCTLDAYREHDRCCLDVKVCHNHQSLDEILRYYTPQLVIQRACTRADRAALLVIHGGAEPRELEAYIPQDYEETILGLAIGFWACVETLTPPVSLPSTPPPPERWRRIELDTEADLYNWARPMIEALETWRSTETPAAQCEAAKRTVKDLLPEDVGTVRYRGTQVSRARNGAVSLRITR